MSLAARLLDVWVALLLLVIAAHLVFGHLEVALVKPSLGEYVHSRDQPKQRRRTCCDRADHVENDVEAARTATREPPSEVAAPPKCRRTDCDAYGASFQ